MSRRDQHAVVVAPTSPNIMLFGCDGGIYRSTDKGQTLSFFGEGMYNTEVLKIDVNGAAAPRVIVGGSQDNDSFGWDGISPVWTDIGPAALILRSDQSQKSLFGPQLDVLALKRTKGENTTCLCGHVLYLAKTRTVTCIP